MRPVAYVTDLEGMWNKLEDFASGNPLVRLSGERLEVAPGALFVYGGDAVDRGPWSRRLVRALLDVKRRQPAQVVLLAGNRDINKLRLLRELDGHPLPRTPREVAEGPRPELLRWIFQNTMGAKFAFDFRRDELRAEGERGTDDEVADSFLADVRAGGMLRQYLALCQLGHREGNALFVHGGVTEHSFGTVPGRERVDHPDGWVEALNGFYRAQLQAFEEGRFEPDGAPAWAGIINYQAPLPGTRLNQHSVVYGRSADALNNPTLPPAQVVAALEAAGVYRLFVGHTPNGDSPSILRDREGFELVIADNSHARVQTGSKVLIREESIEVHGRTTLDDGRVVPVDFTLAREDDQSRIGLRLTDSGHLLKSPLPGGETLLFRYHAEYQFEQVAEPADRLAARAAHVPWPASPG